jgi:hypothetical protein
MVKFFIYIINRSCLDSWKLYVNYKKIKRYFKDKLRFKAFNILKKNLKISKELEKKAKLLNYIISCKKTIIKLKCMGQLKKEKEYNNCLSTEYRRNRLLNRIYRIIKDNYTVTLEKRNKNIW